MTAPSWRSLLHDDALRAAFCGGAGLASSLSNLYRGHYVDALANAVVMWLWLLAVKRRLVRQEFRYAQR